MITIAGGVDVARLLDRVYARPELYRQVVVCSPFIDDAMLNKLEMLAPRVARASSALWIITTPATITERPALSALRRCYRVTVTGCTALHAKFYVALGRRRVLTEAIVTSANFTTAGTTTNIELGIRIASSTESGCRMLSQIDRFARRLAA
jgi:hypothetical protein